MINIRHSCAMADIIDIHFVKGSFSGITVGSCCSRGVECLTRFSCRMYECGEKEPAYTYNRNSLVSQ